MKNKKVKQMMIDVENDLNDMKGYKTAKEKGWHGFDESGLFHCSGSNFMWVHADLVVRIKGKVGGK